MTREDIIRMAREAGFESHDISLNFPKELERFAALVEIAAIKDAPDYKMGYADGVAAERKPLTDEQIDKLEWAPSYGNPLTLAEGLRLFAREVEAAHGIKGDA